MLSQLKNDDAVLFLKKSKASLNENGMIFVKENESDKKTEEDDEDFSYVRNEENHKKLFR